MIAAIRWTGNRHKAIDRLRDPSVLGRLWQDARSEILCGLCVSVALLSVVSAGAGASHLYEGARLIIGDGSPAIEQGAILVERGVIAQVGRRDAVKAPAAFGVSICPARR